MNALILLIATIPYGEPVPDSVGTFDINHVLCPSTGDEVFTQVVMLDFYPQFERSHIIAWRMRKPGMTPERIWPSGRYQLLWQDGDVIRRVRARTLVETHETVDYEMEQRQDFPQERRRELLNTNPK